MLGPGQEAQVPRSCRHPPVRSMATPTVHPQTEDYWGHVNPIGPRSCYDEGKRYTETLFFDYHRQSGLEIKVAPIFNTYGPRMHRAECGFTEFHYSGAGPRTDHPIR